jgi:4-diphosphocytidyl-2-C-methyl-D-erythritol kinase
VVRSPGGEAVPQLAARLAPAKINLTLDVLGRRPDGYHEIDSLAVAVGLADRVSVGTGKAWPGLVWRIDRPAPGDEADLAVRAARSVLADAPPDSGGVGLRVVKQVPAGAGLAGGSSDAAAVLLSLGALCGLEAPEVRRRGEALGSDVAFFLGQAPCARLTGRGEAVSPLPPPDAWLALVVPRLSLATPRVYAEWDRRPEVTRFTAAAVAAVRRHAWQDLAAGLGNGLLEAAFRVEPILASLWREVRAAAGPGGGAGMTGSGSGMFVFTADPIAAWRVARRLEGPGRFVAVTRILRQMPASDLAEGELMG